MSEAERVATICVSAVVCFGFAVVGKTMGSEVLMDFAYAFGGVFGTVVGVPVFKAVGRAIKKLVK